MTHDVFISYANEDNTIAYAVCANLEERRIRCWIAPRDVSPGVYYAQAIIKAIKESNAMVLIFSTNANKSEHVVREAEQAVRASIPIVPFRIDASSPSEMLNYYIGPQHWLDAATPPFEAHVQRLGDAIELLLKTPPEAPHGAASVGSTAQVLGAASLPEGGISTRASKELEREVKPHARSARVRMGRPRSRLVAGALSAAIVIVIVAAGFAFLNPLNSSTPPVTTQPSASSGGATTVLGAGTLVLTASDYVNPNSTLTRGDNITVQLYQGGTYQKNDKTGEITGKYTLYVPDKNHTFYSLYLDLPSGAQGTILLQPNGGFSWSQRDLNATKGFTDLYVGKYVWSTPFKSA